MVSHRARSGRNSYSKHGGRKLQLPFRLVRIPGSGRAEVEFAKRAPRSWRDLFEREELSLCTFCALPRNDSRAATS